MVKTFPKIVLLGDSLTEGAFGIDGYGTAMVSDYSGRCDVINRGYSGYDTRMILRKMKHDDFYVATDPALVKSSSEPISLAIINLGTNDCTSHRVPLDEFESNLTEIVSIFQKSHSADVLLFTPSTLSIEMVNRGFATSGITRPAGYIKNNELHRAYADAVVRVGQQTGSKVVDLYKTFEARSPHQDELFTDGIHYTPKGYAVITRALRKAIDSDLPHLSPWMMPKAHEPFMFYASDDDGLLGEFTAKLNELFTSQGIPGDTFREKLEEKDRRDAMEERKKLLSREI